MNNIANIITQNTQENVNIIAANYNCENCCNSNNNINMYKILICKSDICKGSLKCFHCSTIEENNCYHCSNKIMCNSGDHIKSISVCHYETCVICGIIFCKFVSNRLCQTNDGRIFDKFSTGARIKNNKFNNGMCFFRFFCGEECKNYAIEKGYLKLNNKK